MLRICLGLILAAVAWGQGGDDRLSFEVASVRRSARQGQEMITRSAGGPGTSDPGRFRETNAELLMLVFRAYGLRYEDDIEVKGPAWADTTQFDVEANVPPGTTSDQFRKMLQNLLAERFQLQVHHVTRVASVYELTVARNGPKLTQAAGGSGADSVGPAGGPGKVDSNDFPILPPGQRNVACQHGPEGSHCTFRMQTMETLAERLSLPNMANRRVVNKTGLTGLYDFTLYYGAVGRPIDGLDDSAPSIEVALQDQLGLKLTSSRASIDVLVIDSAKVPTEN